MAELIQAAELLPVVDLLLLNEYDGREVDYEPAAYKLEEYGRDYRRRVERLISAGYLKIATPEETLVKLTIPALKNILRTNGQKLSGGKKDLVTRIVENVPSANYARQIPKFYAATERGRRELEQRSAYIENQRLPDRFLNSEIAAVEARLLAAGEYSADRVFEELFARYMMKRGAAQDFGLLRNSYYGQAQFLKRRGRLVEAVTALLTVIYLDLTGMGNDNTVEDYDSLGWVFETRAWRELDKIRTALNLTDEELKVKFVTAANTCVARPPFSYFSVDTMTEILLARLYGQMDLAERYRSRSRKPSTRSPHYRYYDFSREGN